jgi:hypothetical protein
MSNIFDGIQRPLKVHPIFEIACRGHHLTSSLRIFRPYYYRASLYTLSGYSRSVPKYLHPKRYLYTCAWQSYQLGLWTHQLQSKPWDLEASANTPTIAHSFSSRICRLVTTSQVVISMARSMKTHWFLSITSCFLPSQEVPLPTLHLKDLTHWTWVETLQLHIGFLSSNMPHSFK